MAKKQTSEGDQVEARVLVSCGHGSPGDVVLLTAQEAANGSAAGEVDTSPAAVAYAKGEAARQAGA